MNTLASLQIREIPASQIQTAEPREIDTVLSHLYDDLNTAAMHHDSALDGLHYAAQDKRRGGWGRDRQEWNTTDSQAIERCREIAATDDTYIGTKAQEALNASPRPPPLSRPSRTRWSRSTPSFVVVAAGLAPLWS